MRKQSILAAAFVAAAALSFGASSATADKAATKDESAVAAASQDATPMTEMREMDETMRQHMAAAASTAEPKKRTAAQDRTKHLHPRDGK